MQLEVSPMVFTVNEAAQILAVSPSQIYALCQSGDLAAVRVGKVGIRISRAELMRFINSGGVEPASGASKAEKVRQATRKLGASSAAWRS